MVATFEVITSDLQLEVRYMYFVIVRPSLCRLSVRPSVCLSLRLSVCRSVSVCMSLSPSFRISTKFAQKSQKCGENCWNASSLPGSSLCAKVERRIHFSPGSNPFWTLSFQFYSKVPIGYSNAGLLLLRYD